MDIGRYTLIAKIAMGGMAEIWLARQTGVRGFEKVVVVKRIRDHLCKDEEFVEMFLDEARIAAQLNHPGIVQIFDLGSYGDAYYISMEYLCGEPLSRVIKGGVKAGAPLPVPYAVKLVAQAAEALAYAHSRAGPDGRPLNLIHRDISPPNLVVTYDGAMKIVDFGIAKVATRTNETQLGKIKGKIEYMAPEQARAGRVDHRADLFSLGIVLWEALARSRLVVCDDPVRALTFIVGREPFPSPASRNPEIPPDLGAIVARALTRDPAHRFQSGTQLAAALEAWLKSRSLSPASGDIAKYMRETFSERLAAARALLGSAPAAAQPTAPRRRHLAARVKWACGAVASAVMVGALGFVAPPAVDAPPSKLEKTDRAHVPLGGGAKVESAPAGAFISVDGVLIGRTPLTVTALAPGTHRVTATLHGYEHQSQELSVAGGEMRSLAFTLRSNRPETPPEKSLELAMARPARVVVPTGRLSIVTRPWSDVYLGRKKLGDTPLINLSLPAGRYTLRLVNPDTGREKTVSVEVRARQMTAVKESL